MDENDINALSMVLPRPKGGGGLSFKQGVINPWRVIGDFELFIFTGGDARMTVDDVDCQCPDGSFVIGEIAQRPPGANISIMTSYAYDTSIYKIWCRAVIDGVTRGTGVPIGCSAADGSERNWLLMPTMSGCTASTAARTTSGCTPINAISLLGR